MREISRRTILAVLAAAAAAPLAASAATPGARAFLAKLYAAYQGKGKGLDYSKPRVMARYFTPELAELVRKSLAATKPGDAPDLEGDPFIDAQDWKITKLTIEVAEQGADAATGTVKFLNFDKPRTIVLDLKLTKAGWRIDDIHWPDNDGTLRQVVAPGGK